MPGKESKMSFILSAKADGSFSSTFSKAQQELSKMQQEIQRLNSVQGDISSYQKQQQAIEATSNKLRNLYQQQELLKRQKEEMQAAGQSTAALEREELKLAQQIQNTENKLGQQNQKLSETGERLRQAGVDTGNLTSESKRLEQEMGQLKQEQEKVADSAEKMGQGMASAFDAAGSALAAAGIIQGLREIYGAFKECVDVAAEFESTMSTVEALSGANQEEMAALSAQAKELGATKVFTAQQAGDAMTYMGMAGWKAQDMISGMDGVLNLAAASGEDLAMVSDIVTDNLTAFGLKASDTARFADVLAAAATNSNTSVSIMGETFKQSAAIAGALGYSIEDVAVAVGLMANAGIKGSISGTSLKNTFNGLLEGATLTGQAFGEYTFTAIQADGTMKDFKDTLDELRGVFGQMTEAEKVQNAQLIAGKRGYNGLMAILNATEEDYQKLTSAINDSSGAAERMSKIKLDNLKGDLALANSAAEALKDTAGEALIPILRSMTQATTDGITAVNAFAQAHPEAIQAVAALTAGLGAAIAGLVAFAAAVKVIQALNLAALFASPVAPLLLLTGAFAGLAAVGIAGADAAKAQRGEYYQLTAASQKQYREAQSLRTAYEQVTATKFQDTAETIALRAQVDQLTEAYEANKQTLADWQAENDSIISSVQALHDSHQEAINGISDESAEVQALAYRLDQLAGKSKLTATEQQQMLSIVDRLNNSVPNLGLEYDKATGNLNMGTEAIKKQAQAQAKLRYEEEKAEHQIDLYTEKLRLEDQEREAKENLAAAQAHLNELEGAQGPGSTMQDRQMYQEAAADVAMYQGELDELQSSLASVNAELGQYDAEAAAAASSTGTLEGVTDNLETALTNLNTVYASTLSAAKESLEGQFSLWEKAAEVSATSMSTLQSNIQSQIDYWNNYNTNLETVRTAAQNAGIDLSGIWGHLTDGSADAVNAVAGIAAEINSNAESGSNALRDYVESYGQLQDAMGETAETIASGSEGVQAALDAVRQALETGAADLNFSKEFGAAAQETMQAYIDGFGEDTDIGSALSGMADQVRSQTETLNLSSETEAKGIETAGGYPKGLAEGAGDVSGPLNAMRAQAEAGVQGLNLSAQTSQSGFFTVQGFVQAVTANAGQMGTALSQGGTNAINQFNASLGVSSPSTITNQSGVDTIQGFVNGVNATAPQGASAMQNAANSAINAFRSAMPPDALYSATYSAMQGAVRGINAGKAALVAAARSAGQAAAAAFREAKGSFGELAVGTKSAAPGLTWVGEQGPELVFFKSGVTASAIKDYATLQTSVQGIPAGAMLVGTHGPELVYMQGGETVMTAVETATVLRRYREEREDLALSVDSLNTSIPAYAAGTQSAQRGAALVGENGPELVYMQGGETVLPAPETARALTAAATEAQDITQVVTILPQAVEAMAAYRQATQRTETERIQAERMDRIIESVRNYESREVRAEEPASAPVQIVINISGNPSPETVDRLEELVYSDAFAQRVEEVMEQAQRDTARRAYR